MLRALKWMMVAVLCCAAGVALVGEQLDVRLLDAQKALVEAVRLAEAGKYADAIPKAENALRLHEAVLGGTHPKVAGCLRLLGLLFMDQRDTARAEPILQRALAIREAALGKHHLDLAQSLTDLGRLYHEQGLYARTEPLYERALAIREAALGKHHPDVALSLNRLATIYSQQMMHARAEPLYERVLAIQETALGKHHPHVAASLHNLANLYVQQSLYARAEPLYQRALTIQETALGEHHPDVATGLNSLAALYTYQSLHARAEPLYERALAIREAALGEHHPDVAQSLTSLAILYYEQGLYGRAEPLYERALAIQETALGKHHPDVALSLRGLADLYDNQGLHARAETLYERALAILEAALGMHHPHVATMLTSLASSYARQGLYARAEPLYERALAIQETALGRHHPSMAGSLSSLANFYTHQDMYARAEPLYERALAILETAFGKQHPRSALSLYSLAHFYTVQGLHARAEPLYERAFVILEATLGKSHPYVGQVLNKLAWNYLAQERLSEAMPLLTRAFTLSEQRLQQEALAFSESRLTSFLQFLRTDEENLYALLRLHPNEASVQRLAFATVLLRKGRSIEEIADTSRTIYRSLGEQDRDTFERLRGLRTQLAQLSLDGPGSLSTSDYQQRLKDLTDQGNALETDLARRSARFRALTALPPPEVLVDRIAATLPPDGALIEFITYADRSSAPKPGTPPSKRTSQLRYLALVLFPDASIRTFDLGPANRIDLAVSNLRSALTRRDAAYQRPAQALYALAVQPLLPLLGNARRLFLAPDGQLGLVPFDALHDGQRFLIDAFDFTYLTSGKDLLPRDLSLPQTHSVVVLSDPDFGALPATPSTARTGASSEDHRSPALERFFSKLSVSSALRSWAPLPGTRREAEAIQRLLPQAQLFLGPNATKQQLLRLAAPGVLHIATHGFFLEDATAPSSSRGLGHIGGMGIGIPAYLPSDPLLRSGLVLAGAHASPASNASSPASARADSSLVTALELAGLDLWGTQLVVLSACDTGRGDVRLGQGVYGLRRSFIIAGAETVVMSVWKVDDDSTHLLMEDYYRHLLAGKGRAQALRDAARGLRETRPHPYYWAPFIALGRDTPLRILAHSWAPVIELSRNASLRVFVPESPAQLSPSPFLRHSSPEPL